MLLGLLLSSGVFWMLDSQAYPFPAFHMFSGGAILGAFFIATDPVTGAMTDPGRWGFGLLVGGLTVVIRLGNVSYYESMIFAILLASLFSPLIDYIVVARNIRRRRLRLQEVASD